MNNVISTPGKIKNSNFKFIGKSKLNGLNLYEVSDLNLLKNRTGLVFTYNLLTPLEIELNVCPYDYINTEDIYDPYNYKSYYTTNL